MFMPTKIWLTDNQASRHEKKGKWKTRAQRSIGGSANYKLFLCDFLSIKYFTIWNLFIDKRLDYFCFALFFFLLSFLSLLFSRCSSNKLSSFREMFGFLCTLRIPLCVCEKRESSGSADSIIMSFWKGEEGKMRCQSKFLLTCLLFFWPCFVLDSRCAQFRIVAVVVAGFVWLFDWFYFSYFARCTSRALSLSLLIFLFGYISSVCCWSVWLIFCFCRHTHTFFAHIACMHSKRIERARAKEKDI